jgi:mycothiol synthase
MIDSYPFEPVDLANVTAESLAPISLFNNSMRKEYRPDDPPLPLDEYLQLVRNIPEFIDVRLWALWNEEKTTVIGQIESEMYLMGENQHVLMGTVEVSPEYRRRGLGKKLFGKLVQLAIDNERSLIMMQTYSTVPAGKLFMEHIEAKPGLATHINQLRVQGVDGKLMQQWINEAKSKAVVFELGFWDAAYPDEEIDVIAKLWDLTNQAPRGELEFKDVHMSADELRQMEKMYFARGIQRWTFYVKEKSSGKFAGYTETMWNPNRPMLLEQGFTGVFPEFRGKGLGRWLKAAMIEKILVDRPQVQFIRTQNADINEHMLRINNEMGFKPYISSTIWQIETQQAKEYVKD